MLAQETRCVFIEGHSVYFVSTYRHSNSVHGFQNDQEHLTIQTAPGIDTKGRQQANVKEDGYLLGICQLLRTHLLILIIKPFDAVLVFSKIFFSADFIVSVTY